MSARTFRGVALAASVGALALAVGLPAPARAEIVENEGGPQTIEVNKTYHFTTEDPSALGLGQDQDWWRFTLPENGTVQLEVTSRATADADPEAGWSFDLRTSEGTDEFGSPYGGYSASIDLLSGEGTKTTYVDGLDAGTYDISVLPDLELGYGQSYDLTVKYTPTDEWESETNDGTNKADELALDEVKYGRISNLYDQDWFAFTMPGFGTVEFTLDGTHAVDGVWILSVVDDNPEDGAVFEKSYDSSSTHKTGAIELAPGTHYVRVAGFQWNENVIGCDYSISVKFTPTAEIPMYRLYNQWTGEHLFTASATERDDLDKIGWDYEGVAWTAPGVGDPVYRLYNPYTGDHHYTMKADEYEALGDAGWSQEGVAWYSAEKGSEGAQPLYRLFNPFAQTATHHYTASVEEYNDLAKIGWEQEGEAWYGVTPAN